MPIADNVSGLKNLIHNEVDNTGDEAEYLAQLHHDAENTLSYHLQNNHESELDNDIPTNTYDKLFFGGFEIGNENFETYL